MDWTRLIMLIAHLVCIMYNLCIIHVLIAVYENIMSYDSFGASYYKYKQ